MIAKLAHLARTEPESMARADAVCLPHDWPAWRLTGELVTDRGDASGSGSWSPGAEVERRDLLALAVGTERAQTLQLPRVLGPDEPAGTLTAPAAADLGLPAGLIVGAGTGDNMAGALGLGAAAGEAVVSLGTSGTAFMRADVPSHDSSGEVCGFADATGLPVQLPAGDEHAARGAAVQAAAPVRGDSVGSMAADWRPDRIEQTMPRPQFQAAFRLPERRALIAALG